ncbi:LamG domain-containing protein [Nafulsella turpanensis]|uniref:LamG domain-containing protein n=1 Tax=Nafulsella turpanensis TaxID=1265690 RepID=UPI000347D849|nr:LamG domain-containing protein [Nafulsella turpanensis]
MYRTRFIRLFFIFLFVAVFSACNTEGEIPGPTGQEKEPEPTPEGGLLLHYDFTDGATDLSENGYDGKIIGDPGIVQNELVEGSALRLNETEGNNGCNQPGGDYIKLPELGEVWAAGFTIVARVQFEENRSYERIFDMGNGLGERNGRNVTLSRLEETNDLALTSWINADSTLNREKGRLIAPDVIVNGELQQFAATIDPEGVMKIFVDGEKVAQRNDGHPVLDIKRVRNYIGHSNYCYLDPDFKGLIDDIKIYNKTLTEEEIKELYIQ